MKTDQNKPSERFAVTRQAEEAYLAETLSVIADNIAAYTADVDRMQADIDEMLEHYHDNDAEVYTILSNTITLHDHMKRALARNEKARNKPYFGRILFYDETEGKEESLYIGRGGISRDSTHWMVVDWRAPVANVYYENGLGKCTYQAPGEAQVKVDLKQKRTYEIDRGRLLDYFDSEVIANDELLTKYLARNKQAVLGEIVATIQKEQNEIIRKSPYHNMIVQGVAGSGKTTVAMHRISYILYNYAERFRPEDFYIVGSNRILLNYITGVLPDLDVYGVRQMTMEQLFVRLLYEDWDDGKYRIKSTDRSAAESIKGSRKWFQELEDYCRRLERETICRESVFLDTRRFVEGLRDGKSGVYDESGGTPPSPRDLVRLVDGEAVKRYVSQNPSVSIQSKILMLNERLTNRIKEEFLGKGVKYTEAERKAILKAFRNYYGGKQWKGSIYELYRDFLTRQRRKGFEVILPENEFDVYDLAALAYLYKRVKETEVISEAHHVVIDEAQDFGMMAYCVLKFCMRGCTYTVMGDVSQNIHFGYGLNDWEELRKLLLPDAADSFGVLRKSYRNTVEISQFATNILNHGQFSVYPVEPIIRHGDPVCVKKMADREEMLREAAGQCRRWQQEGLETIAVVCRSRESASRTAQELGRYLPVMESDPDRMEFGSGVMVLPVELTKGLEFDAVLILEPAREEYPLDDGHARLLYVAATRALHRLCVYHTGPLTGLIADPIPKKRKEEEGVKKEGNGEPGRKPEMDGSGGRRPDRERKVRPGIVIARGEQPERGRPCAQTQEPARDRPSARLMPSGKTAPAAKGMPATGRATPVRPTAAAGAAPSMGGTACTGSAAARDTVSTQSSVFTRDTASAGSAASFAKTAPPAQAARPSFGDMPLNGQLRPPGHSRIDLAVKWVEKKPDGLLLHSRYGALYLRPIMEDMIRVTFTRAGTVGRQNPPAILPGRPCAWTYQASGSRVELVTDELRLSVDKNNGNICYMTRDKRVLLTERSRECRQIEPGAEGNARAWVYFDWVKGESLQAFGTGRRPVIEMSGSARYFSGFQRAGSQRANSQRDGLERDGAERPGMPRGGGEPREKELQGRLPLMVSSRGYAILMGSGDPAMCCNIAAYGSYLYTESAAQIDFYFMLPGAASRCDCCYCLPAGQ